jgi:hypothetical protein
MKTTIQSILEKDLFERLNRQAAELERSFSNIPADQDEPDTSELDRFLDEGLARLNAEEEELGETNSLADSSDSPDEENLRILQDISNSVGAVDLWMAEGKDELLFAASLLVSDPKDSFLPMKNDDCKNGGTAFLFYQGNPSGRIMVASKEGDSFSPPRRCLNDSWEDELYSNKSEQPRIIFFPTDALPRDRGVLLCRIQTDITDADIEGEYKKQLDDYCCFSDYLKGRQVFFVSPSASALISLRENAWWNRFSNTGRFHIVICNLRNISVGEDDATSPIQGALRNIEEQKKRFYPNAWRHVVL